MMSWIKDHKVLTSAACLLLAAALVGGMLLLAGQSRSASVDGPAAGIYSGISENDVVNVTLPNGTAATQYAGTRDPYYWPFASDSVWNMPIGSDANLTTVPVFGYEGSVVKAAADGTGNKYSADKERIYPTTKTDTSYMVIRGNEPCSTRAAIKNYLSAGGTFTYKGKEYNLFNSTGTNYQYNKGSAYWPTGLVVNDDGNEIAAIVQPDRRTVAQFQSNRKSATINDGLALFPYDGTYDSAVPDSQKFLISHLALVDLYGDGIYGSHWGSALSAMGGSIREGELSGDADIHIHHALKLNVDQLQMFYGIVTEAALNTYNKGGTSNGHYEKGDVVPGYTWPATARDGQTKQRYSGANPFVTMGSLLALTKQDVLDIRAEMAHKSISPDIQKLIEKFLYALEYYGCYIVDNTAYHPKESDTDKTWSTFAWSVSDLEMDKVLNTYNVFLSGYNRSSTMSGNNKDANVIQKKATQEYCQAMDMIIVRLRAVINNAPGSVGGGGTPSKPLAPEIVPLEGITAPAQTIPVDSFTTLNVVCTPANASVQDVTYASTSDILEISADGKTLKGLSAGTATVTVTSAESGFTATCTVTVGGGDVNGDGKVDAKDYATLSDALSKGDLPTAAEEKKRYDINGDGIIDNDDLDALKKRLLKGGSAQ